MKQQLEVRLSQKMVMTPQLQQAIHLLMLNRLDLAQEMREVVLENPVLEIEEESVEPEEWSAQGGDGESLHSMGEDARQDVPAPEDEDRVLDPMSNWEYSVDENLDEESYQREERTLREADSGEFSFEKVLAAPTSLADHLEWQLSFTDLSSAERALATFLIGNLDEDGYLHIEPEEIPVSLLKNVSLTHVMETIQGFDPLGVGARSLQECLMIQVRLLGEEKGPSGHDEKIPLDT